MAESLSQSGVYGGYAPFIDDDEAEASIAMIGKVTAMPNAFGSPYEDKVYLKRDEDFRYGTRADGLPEARSELQSYEQSRDQRKNFQKKTFSNKQPGLDPPSSEEQDSDEEMEEPPPSTLKRRKACKGLPQLLARAYEDDDDAPNLGDYFAEFGTSLAQQVKICRGYASYIANAMKK